MKNTILLHFQYNSDTVSLQHASWYECFFLCVILLNSCGLLRKSVQNLIGPQSLNIEGNYLLENYFAVLDIIAKG